MGIDDFWRGGCRTVIGVRWRGGSGGGVADRPAVLEEITEFRVVVIVETPSPFRDVQARGNGKTKGKGIGFVNLLQLSMKRDYIREVIVDRGGRLAFPVRRGGCGRGGRNIRRRV